MALTPDGGAAPKAPPAPLAPPVAPYQPYGGQSPDARSGSKESYPNQPGIAGALAPSPYDYSGDPVLQQIQAYDVKVRTDATAAAIAARKALAIQFGDPSGITDDTATGDAAKQNPFSILSSLKRGYDQTVYNHGEQINKNNLWYSGFHAKTATDDATGYQQQQYDARNQVLGQLGGINQTLAGALSGADAQDIQGQQDAAQRAEQQALTYGYDPGANTPTTQIDYGQSPNLTPAAVKPKATVAGALTKPKIVNPYTTGQKLRG